MNITADGKCILTAGVRTGSSASYRPPLDTQIPKFVRNLKKSVDIEVWRRLMQRTSLRRLIVGYGTFGLYMTKLVHTSIIY
jgi:hypothetical protein